MLRPYPQSEPRDSRTGYGRAPRSISLSISSQTDRVIGLGFARVRAVAAACSYSARLAGSFGNIVAGIIKISFVFRSRILNFTY